MADNTKLLLFGAAGVAIWYYFFYTPAAAAPAAPAGGAAPPVNPPANTGAVKAPATIDQLYQSILLTSGNPSAGLGVDQWGYYLNAALSAAGKPASPDPMPIFSAAIPNFDRSQLIPIAQYWAAMAPALKTQLGLSGLGAYGAAALISQSHGRGW